MQTKFGNIIFIFIFILIFFSIQDVQKMKKNMVPHIKISLHICTEKKEKTIAHDIKITMPTIVYLYSSKNLKVIWKKTQQYLLKFRIKKKY